MPSFGIDKLSTTGTYGSIWRSNVISVSNKFSITRMRLSLGATLATGMSIIPKIYLDDGSTVKTLTTINSTNYSGRKVIYRTPEIGDYIGSNNFMIELNFGGTVYCPVLLPIIMELDLWTDESND